MFSVMYCIVNMQCIFFLRTADEVGGVDEKEMDTGEGEEGEEEPRPRALHRTCSIFLRNLVPTITKQEVEAVCPFMFYNNNIYLYINILKKIYVVYKS